jgi:hypothetical protein
MKLIANFMKILLLCSLGGQSALASFTPSAAIAQTTKAKFVQSIIEKFQPQIISRVGQPLRAEFYAEPFFTLGASCGGAKSYPHMSIYSKILELPDLSLAAAVCHELGHILGDVSPNTIHKKSQYDPRDSYEGEADYFAGKCMHTLYQKTDRSILIAAFAYPVGMVTASKTGSGDIKFNGINEGDNFLECRVLSYENGLDLKPRPKCWYNPKVEK